MICTGIFTGAASGIGRSVCQVFAREGATIVAVDTQEEPNMETLKSLAQGLKLFLFYQHFDHYSELFL